MRERREGRRRSHEGSLHCPSVTIDAGHFMQELFILITMFIIRTKCLSLL